MGSHPHWGPLFTPVLWWSQNLSVKVSMVCFLGNISHNRKSWENWDSWRTTPWKTFSTLKHVEFIPPEETQKDHSSHYWLVIGNRIEGRLEWLRYSYVCWAGVRAMAVSLKLQLDFSRVPVHNHHHPRVQRCLYFFHLPFIIITFCCTGFWTQGFVLLDKCSIT
jgi:hypothetical protein